LPEYIFFLLRTDGTVASAKNYEFADDLAAKKFARFMFPHNDVEVRQGSRLILRMDPYETAFPSHSLSHGQPMDDEA
jgi:hypothetical protein